MARTVRIRKPKLVDKRVSKLTAGACRLCGSRDAATLDLHRIQGGNTEVEYVDANRYTDCNTVVLCANCHRLVHDGQVVIHRWFHSTAGRVLHVTRDGKDQFL